MPVVPNLQTRAAMLATSKAMIVEAPDWHSIRTFVEYVSRKMGLKRQAVAKWVKEFRKTGQIKGSSKLDSHREYICSIVEQDPRRSVSEILRIVNKADIEVSFCALNNFIKNRGYARDAEGARTG